jgi:hypothetical protein
MSGCSCKCTGATSSTGSKGDQGATGSQGEFGGFSGSWIFSTSTAVTPAATFLRLNNATPSAVTAIYVSDTNSDSIDFDAFLDSFSNDSKFGYIRIFKETDNTKFCTYKVTAVTDNGADHTLTVTYISSNSTFAASDPLVLTFSPSGGTNPAVLSNNTTDVATSGTGTDALMSYVVSANTLKTNEDVLKIEASYSMSGLTQNKNISFSINGANFISKLPAYPVANTIELAKGVKYAKVKISITRKSTLAVFIGIDVHLSDDVYMSLRGFHFDEGTGAGYAVADLSLNTLTFACFGSNYDATSNTETITQNQLLVEYYNK